MNLVFIGKGELRRRYKWQKLVAIYISLVRISTSYFPQPFILFSFSIPVLNGFNFKRTYKIWMFNILGAFINGTLHKWRHTMLMIFWPPRLEKLFVSLHIFWLMVRCQWCLGVMKQSLTALACVVIQYPTSLCKYVDVSSSGYT